MLKHLKTKLSALAGASLAAMAATPAFASTTGTSTSVTTANAFDNFRDTVLTWAQGSLGTGLAVTMMLMGAGMGVARNSPMPALSGVAGAAFLNWGPGIIQSMTNGALI